MDINVYKITDISDDRIRELIAAKESFVLEGIERLNMGEAVEATEKAIESAGYRCRIYSKGRIASIGLYAAAGFEFPPAVPIIGFAAGLAIGAHNLATFNPDYEIAKNIATGTLTVTWKKG